MIGTTAALIMGGLSAAGALGGAAVSSSASNKAAQVQEDSTKYAADLQKQESDAALALQREQFDAQQANLAPWIKAGTGALGLLSSGTEPGGSLVKPFDASMVDLNSDPGYQFRVQQGLKALSNEGAAKGGLVSGGAMEKAMDYASGLASQEYNQAFQRAFNTYETNQSNEFNRLAALANVGQTSTAQLNQAGANYASGSGTILMNTGQDLANLATQAGNARASGYVGAGNAWGQGLGSTMNSMNMLGLLAAMGKIGKTGG